MSEKEKPMSFLEWRGHLCPQSKSMLACFDCDHYTGERSVEPWPDFCDVFTGNLWRQYYKSAAQKAEAVA